MNDFEVPDEFVTDDEIKAFYSGYEIALLKVSHELDRIEKLEDSMYKYGRRLATIWFINGLLVSTILVLIWSYFIAR